jgi:hypothetical protein
MNRVKEIMGTATQSERYAHIIEVAGAAIDRGIDPTTQEMVDVIRAAVPGADQREIDEALRWNLDGLDLKP